MVVGLFMVILMIIISIFYNISEFFIQYDSNNDSINDNSSDLINAEKEWNYTYELNIPMLPQSIISIDLGYTILYLGKAMIVLNNKNSIKYL